jgi:hypothetical protein
MEGAVDILRNDKVDYDIHVFATSWLPKIAADPHTLKGYEFS